MARRSGIKVRGERKVKEAIRRKGKAARRTLAAALFIEGEGIMAESKEEVPVDEGTLRGTGHVEPPVHVGAFERVKLGYGGPAAPYAEIVHEDLEARHEPPTKAKYLSDPMDRAIIGMVDRIATQVGFALQV